MLMIYLLGCLLPIVAAPEKIKQDSVNFSVNANGITSSFSEFALFILPNTEVPMSSSVHTDVSVEGGALTKTSTSSWTWTSPSSPQVVKMDIVSKSKQKMRLNLVVLRPASEIKNDTLNGYKIGRYPAPYKGLLSYRMPKGFIEVTPEIRTLRVSPHFTLEQFLCKQPARNGYPYIVLKEHLLIKLESILKHVNELGIHTESFVVMSGYRTPYYNKQIGSKVFSRHQYGGAADIYIDVSPKDGMMDDLNKDGVIDKKDADYLYDVIHKMSQNKSKFYPGGLGAYKANLYHGPFVHVDARGTRARWGR